jgi:DNA-directed RNA polymerase specialized sigma24 family protein
MPRDIDPDRRVPIWPLDRSGKALEQDLLDAAERNWERIRAYADRHHQDPSIAANLLETTLIALSRARKSTGRPVSAIRSLDSYLYLAFIRRLNRQLAREPKIEGVGSTQDLDTLGNMRARSAPPSIEQELLVKEVMTFLDEKPRQMFALRYTGYSWSEIASFLKTTANNAQVSFNLGLKRARNRVMTPKGARNSGKGGAADE